MKCKILFFSFIIFFSLFETANAQVNLKQLIPDFNINSFYKKSTGATPNAQRFGAWSIAPHGDSLYLGFGTASPAEYDGALLAVIEGDSLKSIGNFSEQGIHCLKWIGDTLYSIGSDPSITDGWDGGNFYRYIPFFGKLEKFRYNSLKKPILPNVIHSWGLSYDSIANVLYMGTGSYDPVRYSKNGNDCGKADDTTLACFGQLWQSTDMGLSWTLNSGDLKNILSTFRVYDNINFMGNIFIIDGEMDNVNKLKRSSDNGKTWFTYPGINPAAIFRMCVFRNQLIVGSNYQRRLYRINQNLELDSFYLPGPLFGSFNIFTNIEDKYLAAVFSNGSVKATMDLLNWTELILASNIKYLTISYWPERKSLILGEMDSTGGIWQADISEFLSTDVKSSPEQNYKIEITNNILKIYPISSDYFSLSIFNVLGQEITVNNHINLTNQVVELNLTSLHNGIYFVRLIQKNNCLNTKFILNKN